MIPITIQPKLFFLLFFSFIIMTVVGTLSHELGHYTMARLMGYNATINYQSTHYTYDQKNDPDNEFMRECYKRYKTELKNGTDFPGKEKYFAIGDRYTTQSLWITWAGPLQTMLTGSIGFVLLLSFRRRVIQQQQISIGGWVLVLLSLFWLRQLANLFVGVMSWLLKGRTSISGDEMSLAAILEWPLWSIQISTGLIAIGVLAFIVLRIIPKNQIVTFLVAGFLGGIFGYYLWLFQLGPVIMP